MEAILDKHREAMMGGTNAFLGGTTNTPSPSASYQSGLAPYPTTPMAAPYITANAGNSFQQPQETNWASGLASVLQNLGDQWKNKQKQNQLNNLQDFSMNGGGGNLA